MKHPPLWATPHENRSQPQISREPLQTNWNMQNCDAHLLRPRLEIPTPVNSLQKIKIISLSWKLVPRLIWMSRNQLWWLSLFLLLSGNTFWGGQIWSKNLNFQFKLKLDTNSKKTFTVLSSAGNTLLDKFDSKNQNC